MSDVSHLEVLVEEESMARTLHHVLPRILGDLSHQIRTFNGKTDLLRKLPDRLGGYAKWFSGPERVVVVVDRDDDDRRELKADLDDAVRAAGLSLCSVPRDPDDITRTWESLEKVLQDAGYHRGGLRKLALADDVAPHLTVENNRSISFQAFVSGVRYLTQGAA